MQGIICGHMITGGCGIDNKDMCYILDEKMLLYTIKGVHFHLHAGATLFPDAICAHKCKTATISLSYMLIEYLKF